MNYPSLNPTKALIWRIVHQDNVAWLLANGLHCGNSQIRSPNWVTIGNPELIQKRAGHSVPLPPYGVLSDYIPFYFTPFSIMLYNISTGWGGVQKRSNEEIVILVSSLHEVSKLKLPFVFTNKHAYYQWAEFYNTLTDLNQIDWPLLQHRDFKRDPNDPEKFERYQAEALLYRHCPVDALLGMICYSDKQQLQLQNLLQKHGTNLPVHVRQNWYFT